MVIMSVLTGHGDHRLLTNYHQKNEKFGMSLVPGAVDAIF
jgi:hypothetical protein